MTSTVEEWMDSLDNQIADGTSNKGDIPAEYDFNSDRHRAYETPDGGSRTRIVDRGDLNGASDLVKIGNTTRFSDLKKGSELAPSAGDIVEYGSAERFRYVPGYGFLFGVLTLLGNSGDGLRSGQELIVRFGVQDNNYRFRYRADAEHEVGLVKAGSAVSDSVVSQSDWRTDPFGPEGASLSRPLMARGEFVHYGGGEFAPELSYLTSDNAQNNTPLTKTGNREEIATEEVNGFVRVIYDCSDSTSGGTCVVGDIQTQVKGQVKEKDRNPPHRHRDLGSSTNFSADTWETAVLLRIDPNRSNVSTDISKIRIIPNNAAEATVFAVPKETVPWPSSGDWFTPAPTSPPNTALEAAISPSTERTNVPTRDANGETVVEGRALIHTEAQDTSVGNSSTVAQTEKTKTKLHADEYGILAVRFDGSTGQINSTKYVPVEDF
jgi:hypothetical protein